MTDYSVLVFDEIDEWSFGVILQKKLSFASIHKIWIQTFYIDMLLKQSKKKK